MAIWLIRQRMQIDGNYQIKKPSEGGWIDIPANALKTKDNGGKKLDE